ncbi:hypothetical protein BB934_21825 [Microvirga ossetica]|uniref:SHSP domain-containing protein n=1 Tax=Microvirga ossetica TaxID=1882682 RepID=A0A1B2EKR0_9HYPH|nr:hypothetical protein BB934_21825 [Microvirga ossetica]
MLPSAAAIDLGMTHIDTAEIYGDAEPHHDLPPALRPRCGVPGQGREEGPRPRRHARHQGRRGRLPFPVDPDRVQASFENGVLTVTVPKTGQQERSRRIQVQGRSSGGQASQGGQGASGGTGDGGSRGGQGGAPDSTPGGASS